LKKYLVQVGLENIDWWEGLLDILQNSGAVLQWDELETLPEDGSVS